LKLIKTSSGLINHFRLKKLCSAEYRRLIPYAAGGAVSIGRCGGDMGVTQVSDEPRAPERLLNRLWEIARRPFILTILLMAAIIHLAALFGRLPERATQTDFSVYYSSALVLRHGGNPYVTDLTQVARRLGLDVVLALAAKARLCSERAIWAMLASYLLLKVPNDLIEIARRHHRPVLFFGIGEIYFVTLILAYMSAYWLTWTTVHWRPPTASRSR